MNVRNTRMLHDVTFEHGDVDIITLSLLDTCKMYKANGIDTVDIEDLISKFQGMRKMFVTRSG